jgi:hypothetical protein
VALTLPRLRGLGFAFATGGGNSLNLNALPAIIPLSRDLGSLAGTLRLSGSATTTIGGATVTLADLSVTLDGNHINGDDTSQRAGHGQRHPCLVGLPSRGEGSSDGADRPPWMLVCDAIVSSANRPEDLLRRVTGAAAFPRVQQSGRARHRESAPKPQRWRRVPVGWAARRDRHRTIPSGQK